MVINWIILAYVALIFGNGNSYESCKDKFLLEMSVNNNVATLTLIDSTFSDTIRIKQPVLSIKGNETINLYGRDFYLNPEHNAEFKDDLLYEICKKFTPGEDDLLEDGIILCAFFVCSNGDLELSGIYGSNDDQSTTNNVLKCFFGLKLKFKPATEGGKKINSVVYYALDVNSSVFRDYCD